MPRQLMVVHESRTVRNVIKRQILSETPDIVVHDAGCQEEAKDMIRNQPFDLVVCDDSLSGTNGLALCTEVRKLSLNPSVGFVVLLGPLVAALRIPLLERSGFLNYLVSPFTQEQLAAQIVSVSESRKRRLRRRGSVPNTKVLIRFDTKEYQAELISVSATGVLCELRYDEECGDVLRLASLCIAFDKEYGGVRVDNLWGAALRINVESQRPDHSPSRIRIEFMFVNPSDISVAKLNSVLDRIEDSRIAEPAFRSPAAPTDERGCGVTKGPKTGG